MTGELYPSQRILKEEEGSEVPGQTQMESVEHLGQYVYEMTNAKVAQLRAERGLPEGEPLLQLETIDEVVGDIDEDDGYVDAELGEEIEEDVEEEEETGDKAEGSDDE